MYIILQYLPRIHTKLYTVYIRDGLFTVLPPGEAVTELRVCELVQPSGGGHAEVTPHVLIAAEVQLLHRARAGLKTLRQTYSVSSSPATCS